MLCYQKKSNDTETDRPLAILAPLSGFTGSAFRRLARELSADLTWTELISAEMILRRGTNHPLLYISSEERPIRVQLHGSSPQVIARAAIKVIEELCPEGLDLNAGCPARKVINTGAGAALLKNRKRLFLIARELNEVAKTYGIEASVKFRLGFERDDLERIAETLLEAGIRLLALHPRTAKEGFSGKARWSRVRDLRRLVGKEAKVYLSGDVRSLSDFRRAFLETGCQGVMIGRAALERPWIFREIKLEKTLALSPEDRMALLEKLGQYLAEYQDEEQTLKTLKLFVPKFFKGVPGRRKILPALLSAGKLSEFWKGLRVFIDETHCLETHQSIKTHSQFPGLS